MLGEVLAEVTRGGKVESVHAGHVVLLNADGSIAFQKGDPTLPMYSRSHVRSLVTILSKWRKIRRAPARCRGPSL